MVVKFSIYLNRRVFVMDIFFFSNFFLKIGHSADYIFFPLGTIEPIVVSLKMECSCIC